MRGQNDIYLAMRSRCSEYKAFSQLKFLCHTFSLNLTQVERRYMKKWEQWWKWLVKLPQKNIRWRLFSIINYSRASARWGMAKLEGCTENVCDKYKNEQSCSMMRKKKGERRRWPSHSISSSINSCLLGCVVKVKLWLDTTRIFSRIPFVAHFSSALTLISSLAYRRTSSSGVDEIYMLLL